MIKQKSSRQRQIALGVAGILMCCLVAVGVFVARERWTDPIKYRCEVCGKMAAFFAGGSDGDHQFCEVHYEAYSNELNSWLAGSPIHTVREPDEFVDRVERDVDGIKVIGSGLREADVQEIVRVINSAQRDLDKHVLSIRHTARDEAEVVTGAVRGPLDGGGNIILLRKTDSGWKIQRTMQWVS